MKFVTGLIKLRIVLKIFCPNNLKYAEKFHEWIPHTQHKETTSLSYILANI